MRSLFWRLTATYTLVAVATVLVIQLVALVVLAPSLLQGPAFASSFLAGLDGLAPQVRPLLSREPIDLAQVQNWLDRQNFSRQFWTFPSVVLVTDASGVVLASSNPGRSSQAAAAPQLQAALSGDRAPALLAGNDGATITAATPVRAEDGRVLGGLLVQLQDGAPDLLLALFASLLPTGLAVTALFGLAATLASLLTARWLDRRLRRVATAATAWGQGALDVRIADSEHDELGVLATRLDDVASQLQSLVALRTQVGALEERNRIARELHDSVKQQVFALSMHLGAAQAQWERQPAMARAKVDAAADVARLAGQELGSLIQALHPPQLAQGSLIEALRAETERWAAQTGISHQLEIDALPVTLPDAAQQGLFRIAQEALANVAKHSGSDSVAVRLRAEDGDVVLTVCDNGRRGAPQERPGGLGLRGMRERAVAAGGTLEVLHTDEGTRVICRVPAQEVRQ